MASVPLYLAPMASITNSPMRIVSRACGAVCCYTEMINARAIALRVPNALSLLSISPEEVGSKLIAHLYGTDEDSLIQAVEYVSQLEYFSGIDLNAGCPSPTITKLGAGASLIYHPEKIAALIRAMKGHTNLPITLKTRLGPNPAVTRVFEIVSRAEDAGVSAVAVHARYTSEGHAGTPHYTTLEEVKKRAQVPIWGNGNGRDIAGLHSLEQCGVDAILVARGAIGNPWIFENCRVPSAQELRKMILWHLELESHHHESLIAKSLMPPKHNGEDFSVAAFRSHLFRYLRGRAGANQLRSKLSQYRTLEDIRVAIDSVI